MPPDATTSVENSVATAVLLCGDLAGLPEGLKLEKLRSLLEATCPGTAVEVVPNLCGHPAQLPPLVTRHRASRVVLGLCSGEYSQVDLHAKARQIGLDPFGLEVVPLGTLCAAVHPEPQATWKAGTLLAAAVARARAFQGSGPEHTKLYFLPLDQKVSRRSLFTVPPIMYRPVPSVAEARCAAGTGCQLCVGACPTDALRKANGRIFLDKVRCGGCGVCLAACPREAIYFPGWSFQQLEAQLTALLDFVTSTGVPCGLVLTCQGALGKLEELARRGLSYSHQWFPVTVPCLGMVSPTWILQALAHGAEAVVLLSCNTDCPFGQEQAIGGRVDFCCELLRLLEEGNRVRLLNASNINSLVEALQESPCQATSARKSKPTEPLHLGTLPGVLQAIRCLAATDGALPSITLEHPCSPFGVVEFQGEGCTACLACAEACPTGALASEHGGDEVTLTWLASSCTGCGVCADACPERATDILRVRRTTNLDTLSLGRVVLHRDRLAKCEGCGASIASGALLHRLEKVLEGGTGALRTVLSRYCASCRVSVGLGAEPFPARNAYHGD